jgi:hypothetical protein
VLRLRPSADGLPSYAFHVCPLSLLYWWTTAWQPCRGGW